MLSAFKNCTSVLWIYVMFFMSNGLFFNGSFLYCFIVLNVNTANRSLKRQHSNILHSSRFGWFLESVEFGDGRGCDAIESAIQSCHFLCES